MSEVTSILLILTLLSLSIITSGKINLFKNKHRDRKRKHTVPTRTKILTTICHDRITLSCVTNGYFNGVEKNKNGSLVKRVTPINAGRQRK